MGMIAEDDFLNGHAFSFTKQPYLAALFETVIDRDTNITFVVGAGVSLDSGLPPWLSLIDRMCEQLRGDPVLMDLALRDRSDPMRRAELVLEMVLRRKAGWQPETVIRHALYRPRPSRLPLTGPLAEAIAQLGTRLGNRGRLITTNFDEVLETALGRYLPESEIKSYGLRSEVDHSRWSNSIGIGHVLHVHGLVRPKRGPLKPVILTESHFLEHGPKVRALILKQLQASCVIFIGVSLADPNLTGPLWDLRSGQQVRIRPFVLTVPEPPPQGCHHRDIKRYTLENARYLEDKLKMRPIFLKSYAQQIQVLGDLDLALSAGKSRYTIGASGDSNLEYGLRFTRALNKAYESIGCTGGSDSPERCNARKLSDRLQVE